MAALAHVVERGQSFDDSYFQKVDVSGAAWCIACKGRFTQADHLRSKKHLDKCKLLDSNQRLLVGLNTEKHQKTPKNSEVLVDNKLFKD